MNKHDGAADGRVPVKHTPGPWVVKIRPNDRTGSAHYTVENPVYDGPCECGAAHPPGRLIAWFAGGLGDADIVRRDEMRAKHDPFTLADARLVAAAPDMLAVLEALEPVLGALDDLLADCETGPLAPKIRAVILRARHEGILPL